MKNVTHLDIAPHLTRRQALCRMGSGFGLIGLASLLKDSLLRAAGSSAVTNPLDPKPTNFPARAKHVIFLFLNGGLSQVDTFDPKPMLAKYNGQPYPGGNFKTERKTGNLMRSPFAFKECGKSGIEVSEIFPLLGDRIDDVCVVRSVYTDIPNHEPSLFMMNTGNTQPGRPSLGSWLTYGLGTENQNLPGFVVLCPGIPVVGPPLWNSAFLPAVYQGTYISNQQKEPDKLIEFIHNKELNLAEQRRQLDLLQKLNRLDVQRQGEDDPQLEASIHSMEIAYRMQSEAPQVFDVRREDGKTRARYGDHNFGRARLMARRLVERGVRVVQIYFGNGQPWDNHEDITIHAKLARLADAPIAALLEDLRDRGLLHETLVVSGSEFGRTPVVETSAGTRINNGRDHNPYGFSMWLAGGGIKGGMTYGATDEFGFKAVQNPVHVHDIHATILYLLGLNHEKLTYRYSGRDFRLTDVAGHVIHDVIA